VEVDPNALPPGTPAAIYVGMQAKL